MKRLALASAAILAAVAFIPGRADARGFRGAGLGVAGVAGAGGLRTSGVRNGGFNNAGRVGAIGNRSVVARGFAGRGYGRGYDRGLGYGLGGFGYDSCDSAFGYGAYDPVSRNHYGYGY